MMAAAQGVGACAGALRVPASCNKLLWEEGLWDLRLG